MPFKRAKKAFKATIDTPRDDELVYLLLATLNALRDNETIYPLTLNYLYSDDPSPSLLLIECLPSLNPLDKPKLKPTIEPTNDRPTIDTNKVP
jgi:hypothetical protein